MVCAAFESASKRARVVTTIVGVSTFLFSFLVHFLFILNHFYVHGGYLLDSGVFASMMWRSTPFCLTPVQDSSLLNGTSYYSTHLTLLCGLFSTLSYLVPVNQVAWFAFYIGCSFGLLAYSIYYIGQAYYWKPGAGFLVGWFLLATLFANSGFSLAIAAYPHHEIASSGLQILFFALLLQRRLRWASLCFSLAVMVREDVGFHLAAILGLLTIYRFLAGQSFKENRAEFIFLLLALAVSSAGVLTQKLCYADTNNVFYLTYLGDPKTRGLGRILGNLHHLLQLRAYLWVPLVLTFAISVLSRDPILLLALCAYVPWTLLNLHGTRVEPGTLFAYYAYPFYNTFAWILLSPQVKRAGQSRGGRAPYFFLGVVLSSALALGWHDHQNFLDSLNTRGELWNGMKVSGFIQKLGAAKMPSSEVRVDSAVVSLANQELPPRTWTPGNDPKIRPSLLLYWENSIDLDYMNRLLVRLDHPKVFRLPETHLLIVTQKDFVLPPSVSLMPKSLLYATHQLRGGRESEDGAFEIVTGDEPQPFVHFGLSELDSGLMIGYAVDCPSLGSDQAEMQVVTSTSEGEVTPPQSFALRQGKVMLEVPVTVPNSAKKVELTLRAPARSHLRIEDCEFRTVTP